ncbi:MAG: hypothetical protein U0441_24905 [Polyangiaceae bacterium]
MLRADSAFPTIEGNTHAVDLDVHVSSDGTVVSVEVKGSTMGGHESERCMVSALQGASLQLPGTLQRRSASTDERAPSPESRPLVGQAIALAPISFAPLVATGIGIIVVIGIIAYFSQPKHDNEDYCQQLLVECLENPQQPEWNRSRFGPRKDCGACKRYCVNEGYWPDDKCPRTK